MEGLQQFWTWAYLLGCGVFVVMSMIIIPLGLRDLVRLLRDLGRDEYADGEDDDGSS